MFKIKGATRKETIENASYLMFIVSAVLVAVGIGLGSLVHYTVYLAVVGSGILLLALFMFIASQFMEHPKKETV